MKFKKSLLGNMISVAITSSVLATSAQAQEVTISDPSLLKAAGTFTSTKKSTSGTYIVQMNAAPGISKAQELGELLPSNQLVGTGNNNYNPGTANMAAYTQALRERQAQVAQDAGSFEILHSYAHTFNGFSAKLTAAQLEILKNHPEVAGVYEDEAFKPQTSFSPEFLGLTGPGGNHTLGNKGDDVIVGILDSGIWPENPSFADDGSYSDPVAELGWPADSCNTGSVGSFVNAEGAVVYDDETVAADAFSCNNKLIGARYFGASFSSVYEIQFGLGEFASPRDADGHGSHTASTAAGNENVTPTLRGRELTDEAGDTIKVSGVAPRARIAAYKVCWNSDYVSPEGVNERGCFFGDSMAAIDQAVEDGVDVLNYSIGNSNDINTPVYNAALRAAEAGVFFAASAGNSGPGPATTSNIAPWMATVAASTHDGLTYSPGFSATTDGVEEIYTAVEGAFTVPLKDSADINQEIVVADPLEACFDQTEIIDGAEVPVSSPLNNAEDMAGKIALISRGSCAFVDKFARAVDSGAAGVVVYTNTGDGPGIMGGDSPTTIPGVMISQAAGNQIVSDIEAGSTVLGSLSASVFLRTPDTPNQIIGFSSRGENPQTGDIIKPDITAPGVRVLAANSEAQLQGTQGEPFHYLSGTSMSGPHIAGMGALLKEAHPDWSPAQIKSAIMTSARQDLTKEDGVTPADPFDFGAGHLDPVPATNPGLTYDANVRDYFAFLCGQGEEGLVAAQGDDCATLVADGFGTDASQLNYPSIGIESLSDPETITRTVTDVTGVGGTYTVSVDAPLGIDVEVRTFDGAGVETPSADLEVAADGKASYAVTFTKGEGFVPNQYAFGAITLTGTDGTVVRSPIAVKPTADVFIDVPERVALELRRGRASFPVQMLYTGTTSIDYTGLVAPFSNEGSVVNARGANFDFGTAIDLGQFSLYAVPEGTKVARFVLQDSLVDVEGADLDLHVWNCIAFRCRPVAASLNAGSNEEVLLVNPEPRSGAGGDLYVVSVHGYDLGEADTVNFVSPFWIATSPDSSTRISASSRAVQGRFNRVRLSTRGLDPSSLYMGGVTFYDGDGVAQGTTVLEVQP